MFPKWAIKTPEKLEKNEMEEFFWCTFWLLWTKLAHFSIALIVRSKTTGYVFTPNKNIRVQKQSLGGFQQEKVFLQAQAFIKKETLLKKRLAQVFSYQFCQISKNTFSCKHPCATASESICNCNFLFKVGSIIYIFTIINHVIDLN